MKHARAAALLMVFAAIAASPAQSAIIVNFEDLGVAVGTQLNPASGVGVVSQGFNYTPGPLSTSGLNDLHIANQDSIWSSNGTTVGGTHDDVVLTKVGAGLFSLSRFDFAGFPSNNEVPFSVIGTYADLTTISQNFTPDGLVDGAGPLVDFQTFLMVGNWSGLASVTWQHSGVGTLQGLFALDNIVLDEANEIPEPMTAVLFGFGSLGVMGISARRRRRPVQG